MTSDVYHQGREERIKNLGFLTPGSEQSLIALINRYALPNAALITPTIIQRVDETKSGLHVVSFLFERIAPFENKVFANGVWKNNEGIIIEEGYFMTRQARESVSAQVSKGNLTDLIARV